MFADQDEDALANALTDESVLPLLRILDSSNDSCVLQIEKCGWDFAVGSFLSSI
jgi:hypothetical protein